MSGAFAAIKATEKGLRVTLVDKAFFGRGGCAALASGAYHCYAPGDKIEDHLRALGDLVDQKVAKEVVLTTPILVKHMEEWGVKFVKNKDGEYVRTKSGRLGQLGVKENLGLDGGGPQMMMAIRAEALKRGVEVFDRVMINDLLTSDGKLPTGGKVIGAIGIDTRKAEIKVFKAKATIMCTGGYNFPFADLGSPLPSMPIDLSGDGVAAQLRAGCTVGNMIIGGMRIHSIEFHTPPGVEHFTGQDVHWVNRNGEDIIERYNSLVKNTSIRQTVPVAFAYEVKEGRGPVSLDCTHLSNEAIDYLWRVIPIIMTNYYRAGYNLSKDRVPYLSIVGATQGINGGGVVVNERGETSIPGLYAAGACSNGANVRITLSLSESSVLGWWAGEAAAEFVSRQAEKEGEKEQPGLDEEQVNRLAEEMLAPLNRSDGLSYKDVHDELGSTFLSLGTIMNVAKLRKASEELDRIVNEDIGRLKAGDPHELAKVNGLKNSAFVAKVVVRFLLHRTESRGTVVMEDYPETDNDKWLTWTMGKFENGKFVIWDEPIPEESFIIRKPHKGKSVHQLLRRND